MRMAWLLRLVLLVQALALFAWVGAFAARDAWGWAALGALVIALPHAPLMALEFALLRRANRRDPVPPATAGELMRAWAAEVMGAVAIFGWRQPFRWRRHPDRLVAPAPGVGRGLLLVHGFVCNRGVWNPWLRRLHDEGVPTLALNLQPVFGSIDTYAPRIDDAVRRLTAATGVPPLVVAHSMGGLAVRAWLCASGGDARIAGVITVGSPHHGTWLGRFGYSRNARQMRQGSRWLRELTAAETDERRARFTCFYSHCDNIVFPASTATLPGADNRHLRGRAHLHLLRAPAVLAEVLRRLRE